MQAHANDLRVEVAKDWEQLVEPAVRAAAETSGRVATRNAREQTSTGDGAFDEFVHQIVDDWTRAPLSAKNRRLIEYIEKLTRTPSAMSEQDIERLRDAGWSDRAIHDAVQVASYFNYINRVADALGVEVEADLPKWGKAASARND